MRHEKVKVKRDLYTVTNKAVCPWEIPILEIIFEEESVERLNEFSRVKGDYPDPALEFARLTKVYGADTETKVPFAVMAYGNARTGVRNLAKAIQAAREEEAEARKPSNRQSVAHDPLMA